jgi:hypothetical protein
MLQQAPSHPLPTHFIPFWFNALFANRTLSPDHVVSQLIHAFIDSIVSMPSPVRDWSQFGAWSDFIFAIFHHLSASQYQLLRGSARAGLGRHSGIVPALAAFNLPLPDSTTMYQHMPPPQLRDGPHPAKVSVLLDFLDDSNAKAVLETAQVRKASTLIHASLSCPLHAIELPVCSRVCCFCCRLLLLSLVAVVVVAVCRFDGFRRKAPQPRRFLRLLLW